MYYLKILIQFLVFLILFLVTHYWMNLEDVFDSLPFRDEFTMIFFSSVYISFLVVILIQIFSLSDRLFFRLGAFFFAVIQVYLNFSYFEYYIVFKAPLFSKDIVYMESPNSLWQLAEGSIWNIRFPFFVLLPSIVLGLTFFSTRFNFHRKLVFQNPQLKIRFRVGVLMLVVGFSLYQVHSFIHSRTNGGVSYRYNRNPLISIYEAIANYFQFDEEVTVPEDITTIREIYLEKKKRKFVDEKFPLLYQADESNDYKKTQKKRSSKNLIILMFESLPLAEVHALSQNPDYAGTTPFLEEILSQSLYFPNTYASGIHTFYGTSDLLTGNASYQYFSWNKKITLNMTHALPYLLRNNGYQELTWYHGCKDINFDFKYSFSEMTGFNRRVFYDSFSNSSANSNWGKSDRETLMLVARDIQNSQGPFLSFTLTLTKHGPWHTPPDFDYEGFERDYLSRHNGEIPNDGLRNSHRLVYYYDQILKEFFTSLESHPQFENSLVIITADQAFFPDIKGSNQYHNMKNGYNIPLIFYEPGEKTLPIGRNEVFASHLDIIPTLIDYLGLEVPEVVSYQGKSLLDPYYQDNPDEYSHIAFYQDELIHFNSQGLYKFSSLPEQDEIVLIDFNGQETLSTHEDINRMMISFKTVYPYLIKQNLVFLP